MYPDLHLFIGGKWRDSSQTIPVENPATDAKIGDLPKATITDLDDALAAAQEGFEIWRKTAPRDRANTIRRAAALIRERQEEIAHAITLEHGKTLKEARLEVIRGAEFFEWDAGEAMRTYGRVIPAREGESLSVHHQPIGVVAAFSPWNFPMSQPARKIAGALASGCSIILKAAEETPAGAIHIAKAFEDAGLPAGVLNLVFGDPAEISSYLIAQDAVRLVAFTGSTQVGRHLTRMAAEHDTSVLMELGGHAPVIVCEDVDAVKAAKLCATRKFRNAGQVCTSPTRFFVHDSQYDAFCATFAAHAEQIRVGDGLDPETVMGPTANPRRITTLLELTKDALAKGARLLAGGERKGDVGCFFKPTVLVDVPDTAQIMQEEPFGPIAVIIKYSDIDDAIKSANAVSYGLAGYALTNRADLIQKIGDELEVGNFSVNTLEASLPETPFGGVKSSGYGREGGSEGLDNYMIVRNIWVSNIGLSDLII